MAKKHTNKRKPRVKVTKIVPEENKVVLEVHDALPLPEHVNEELLSEPAHLEDDSHPVVKWLKSIF